MTQIFDKMVIFFKCGLQKLLYMRNFSQIKEISFLTQVWPFFDIFDICEDQNYKILKNGQGLLKLQPKIVPHAKFQSNRRNLGFCHFRHSLCVPTLTPSHRLKNQNQAKQKKVNLQEMSYAYQEYKNKK